MNQENHEKLAALVAHAILDTIGPCDFLLVLSKDDRTSFVSNHKIESKDELAALIRHHAEVLDTLHDEH